MNIMKTNMLLLDNKIKKEDGGNTPIMAPIPTPVENPQAGMKALMFKGLQNLMANPALAKEAGVATQEMKADKSAESYVAPFSTNIAFKSGKSKALAMATTALLGMSATSCIKVPDSEPTKVTQVAIQIQNNEAVVAAILVLQQQIAQLQQQLADRDAAQAERDRQMIAFMQSALTIMQNIQEELKNFHDDEQMNAVQLRALLMENNAVLLDAIATINNTSKENAQRIIDTILNAYANGEITFKEAIDQIKDLLGTLIQRLDANFAELFKRDDANKEYYKALLDAANRVDAKFENLIGQINTVIKGQQEEKQILININNDLNVLDGDVNLSRETLVKALEILGYTYQQYSTWNTDRMIEVIRNSFNEQNEVINANGDKIDQISIDLQTIINKYNNHEITEQEALELLRSIDQGIKDLNGKVDSLINLVASFKADLQALKNIGMSISANTGMTAWEVHNLNNQFKNLDNHVVNLTAIAIEVRDELRNGVSLDDSRIIAAIQALNLDMNAGKDEIVAALDKLIPELQNIDNSINKLDKNNQAKFDLIANFLKTVTNDNKDLIAAIADLKNSNETNISAATEVLAGKLDTLIELVKKALDKLDGVADIINNYGNSLEEKFNLNNNLLQQAVNGINLTNAKLSDMQAEVERLRPILNQVNNNIKIGNGYLEEISKKQLPAMQEAIENIDGIGGGLTQEQLREELERFGMNTWNTYGGYFIQAGEQRGEIIELLKALDKKQGDTYEAIINGFNKVGNDTEKLRALLQKVYEYLPELKHECHCECHCPTIEQLEELLDKYKKANEEIIGVLD